MCCFFIRRRPCTKSAGHYSEYSAGAEQRHNEQRHINPGFSLSIEKKRKKFCYIANLFRQR